jgi:hypothetical protein
MQKLVKMFFNADDGAPAGGAPAPIDPPPVAPVVPVAEVPKYTDTQLNDIVKKNVAKELKKAGIDPDAPKPPKAKDADAPDPVKTELEEVKKTTSELSARADKNEAMALALKAGVSDEKTLERVVKLALSPAYDGTIAERIQKIVTEVPEFVKVPGKPFGAETKAESQDAAESLLNQARAHIGLKTSGSGKK